MITVWIDGQQREGIDEGWIAQTIRGLRHHGEDVCVRVRACVRKIERERGNRPAFRSLLAAQAREDRALRIHTQALSVKRAGLDLTMTAGVCPSGGGGRAPNPGERRIFDLWNGCGVQADPDFAPGRLIQCLKRLERAL